MSVPPAKRSRTPRETQEALTDAVRTKLAALPHYSRYCQTRRVCLHPDDPVHEYLAKSFVESVTRHRGPGQRDPHREAPLFDVCRIEKIYCPRLQEAYLAELNNTAGLCERNVTRLSLPNAVPVQSFEGLELNEYLLYHGAPSDMIRRFTEQGLDPRYAGTHFGKLFGNGTYFAAHSSKSDIYTAPNGAGERSVLVVRACLGEPHFEKTDKARREGWLKPPERQDARGPLSSLVAVTQREGGCVEHPEFVVYKDTHSLPQFVIWYKHKPECKCTHCWLTSKIKLMVMDVDGQTILPGIGAAGYFEIRRSDKIQTLFAAIARESTLPASAPRKYTHNGIELTGAETPQDLGMDDRRGPAWHPHQALIKIIDARPSVSIRLMIETQDGRVEAFEHQSSAPLSKLMNTFCNRHGVALSSVSFVFDGETVGPNQTPNDLEMEDEDYIQVMVKTSHAPRESITIKVVRSTGHELYFKLKTTTALSKLMQTYCEHQHVQMDDVWFYYLCPSNARGFILPEQTATPQDLDVKDGDSMEVLSIQEAVLKFFQTRGEDNGIAGCTNLAAASALSITVDRVRPIVDGLLDEGHLYPTIDDDHFKAT